MLSCLRVKVGDLNRCFYNVFRCHKVQRFGHDVGAGLPLNPKQVCLFPFRLRVCIVGAECDCFLGGFLRVQDTCKRVDILHYQKLF